MPSGIAAHILILIHQFCYLIFCLVELETAMNLLLLLWFCGNLFVQYSQGYVGQRCYQDYNCQRNEVCHDDRWGDGTCQCSGYVEVCQTISNIFASIKLCSKWLPGKK